MEKRLTIKIREHHLNFKNTIQEWLSSNNCSVTNSIGTNITSEFLKFIYDTPSLELIETDFMRRKRVKNDPPLFERCTAKRADGVQCTRRKRDDNIYCGTHMKGTPHGIIDQTNMELQKINKIEVWVEDIKGINYYIDAAGNIYKPDDIISGIMNPKIISQWKKSETGKYYI